MSRTFKVGRLGATYYWRIGGLHRNGSNFRCLQKRYYAGRYTFDDLTQSRIDAIKKAGIEAGLPRENPWRADFPENLNDIGYESHCNDRLYMAKNKYRYNQQEYDQKRLERRMEARKRVQKHFNPNPDQENTDMRRRVIMQDPVEHQNRQKEIIEMNRRLWQSRPQVKREINLSGITYRPDNHKQLTANMNHKDLDRQGDFKRYQDKSEAEKEAEAETTWWVRKQMGEAEAETKAEAEESVFERRMKRLMGKYDADQDAERSHWRTKKPRAEAEKEATGQAEDNWWTKKDMGKRRRKLRTGMKDQPRGLSFQRRLRELMEAERKPEAEEEDWRVKSPRAEAEEEDWRVKSPRAEAEEEDWRVRSPRAEAEEEDWRMRKVKGRMEEDWRIKGRRPEAEEEDWRIKARRPEAEEEDWRMRKIKGRMEEDWRIKARWPEAEEEDWRIKARKPEAEEEDWRVNSPRAEAEEEDWRVKFRRPKAEEDWRAKAQNWRSKNPRAEAEEEDWRVKGWSPEAEEEDWRLKGWSDGRPLKNTGLQRRLMELMEAEKKPEAEEEDWRTQNPTAEAEEDRSNSEAETKAEAEDKAWKARNLSPVYDPNRPSKSWQKKRDQDIESQYWHSWYSCPNNQEAETNVEMKHHSRRKKFSVRPPSYTRDGQRRSYHQTALNPHPIETQSEPLDNAPPMPKPLRAIPKKPKKTKPKRKRERKSAEPPRFKMTIRTRPLISRRPVNSHLRRLNFLSEVAGPSFHMDNLNKPLLDDCIQAKKKILVTEN
ncbi:LOW QUALITY PROTEIN: golgin subfamily A member 6-like protein 22 [Drosophila serrata]|uniref:LOW QUALITY PROTEIN: golgin subfamily A member 6-like protein 22 n=1 Tax=Drosophila serrata TaxID=7274 RepID=UPI000A1D13A4|nr:LOW QUALITY PROTEIN: golgin subfamily A member 6-like protein 22 [Drosophila serrata]